MKKNLALIAILAMTITSSAIAGVGLGADAVSRYVWRGTDFGNAASIQPYLSFTTGNLEIGAWASYALTSAVADENDIYISYTIGDLGITLTDYYFPAAGTLFKFKDKDAVHFMEGSLSYAIGDLSIMGAMFFFGDPDDSKYFELGYGLYTSEDVRVGLTVGAGDGMYVTKSDGMEVVNISITASKGAMAASYIVNPESETNFLVFMVSF